MPRDIKSLPDANVAIKELQDMVGKFSAYSVDFHGRKIVNAGKGVDNSDYANMENLKEIYLDLNTKIEEVKALVNFLERRVKVLEP